MKTDVEALIGAAIFKLYTTQLDILLERPDVQFGDYATNIALRLAGVLHLAPRDIAQALVDEIGTSSPIIESLDVAGPGFINIHLSNQALLAGLNTQPRHGVQAPTVLVEYSDPNLFKPLHAGHLYTTLVGDAIARLIESMGAQVLRLNYGGDVGLHVAKNMWSIVRYLEGEHPTGLDSIAPENRATWLGERYVDGNTAYESDPEAQQAIKKLNKQIYKLHAEDDRTSPLARIYWTCRQWSYDYFTELYKALQVKPFDRYIAESEISQLGVDTVQRELLNKVYEKSQGAIIFNGERFGLHARVFITSEGLPTYEAKEVGLNLEKWRSYAFDESLVITASEQLQYMQVVSKSIEQFMPEITARTKHITHGVVKLQGGVKISSRKGNGPSAMDILDSARQAALDSGVETSEETIIAAVKYAFLKQRIGGDIVYDPLESIALEGNSGPYLQYALARAYSILRKSEDKPASLQEIELEAAERIFVRKMTEYYEVVQAAAEERLPHYICTYLFSLAQEFNRFYEHNRVIGHDREPQRLRLIKAYADILAQGLGLLGIATLKKM